MPDAGGEGESLLREVRGVTWSALRQLGRDDVPRERVHEAPRSRPVFVFPGKQTPKGVPG